MALGATCSPDLAERISEASAKELRFVGMNWTYSPVADVNHDPRNPVIGLFIFTYRCNALSYLYGRRAILR
jgi:beta-N-acetylhexosaminidase